MTRVDFYVLPGSEAMQRAQFACRLTDKAYRLGHQVYIHTESAEQSEQIDKLLWTFQQNSFIPHCLHPEAGEALPPVMLGHDAEPDQQLQVLINLATDVPLFFSRFERVAELVDQQPEVKQRGRDRYKFYRDRGYPLESHTIKN